MFAKINESMSDYSEEKTYALFDSPANKKLIGELKSKEIEVIVFPMTTTISAIIEKTFPAHLEDFDWIIFPDVYTVEFFIEHLEKQQFDLFELDTVRVCALGEAVADRLRFSQLHADIIPPTVKTQDVIQTIKDYVFDEDEFRGLRFLVLKKEGSSFEFIEKLRDLEAEVAEIPVYSSKIDDESILPKLKALLKGGAIDEFIFSSHFDVLHLAQLFQTENMTDLLENIELWSIDKIAAQTLQEFRLI